MTRKGHERTMRNPNGELVDGPSVCRPSDQAIRCLARVDMGYMKNTHCFLFDLHQVHPDPVVRIHLLESSSDFMHLGVISGIAVLFSYLQISSESGLRIAC